MDKTIHFLVSGRVQGVCFRMMARQQADLNNIMGWVRNLADGRVEVVATGEKSRLDEFKNWLRQGPEFAQVLKLECEELPHQSFDNFNIR